MRSGRHRREGVSSGSLADRHGGLPTDAARWRQRVDAHEQRVRLTDPHYRAFAEWRPPATLPVPDAPPPFLLTYKDTIDVAGYTTRFGSTTGYRRYPVVSASIVALLERKNFRCIGKVATTEFSLGTRVPSENPIFPAVSPGGSSTGCAVAVAAGFCDVSVGTDTAGSIRWPAGRCGVVGLRLTHDRRLLDGVFPVSPRFEAIGLTARSVEELASVWRRERLRDLVGDAYGPAFINVAREVARRRRPAGARAGRR